MAFELKTTVPWGRTLSEYKSMFSLTEAELKKRIISFGDGPASFNSEMTEDNKSVTSVDPVYQFTAKELEQRIAEVKDMVIEQTRNNQDNFVWKQIKSVEELEQVRLNAMQAFIKDFSKGKAAGRYVFHALPDKTAFEDLSFDLAISSHFLILYAQLGLDFHITSITEMLRLANEVRIFPILDLDAKKTELLEQLITHFNSNFKVSIEKVDYEFQKGGNEMLRIKRD
ncbi:SAM-dependent methyltransferase [Labilibacter marinus]|uniref:SAM-dependent methyltransferase n=1 Tax=Labilibacter marinus TaxID=1477105 RepID=UPI000830D40F|nr:SAM-dependent methyltransferase [Labilibacter marinus]